MMIIGRIFIALLLNRFLKLYNAMEHMVLSRKTSGSSDLTVSLILPIAADAFDDNICFQ